MFRARTMSYREVLDETCRLVGVSAPTTRRTAPRSAFVCVGAAASS